MVIQGEPKENTPTVTSNIVHVGHSITIIMKATFCAVCKIRSWSLFPSIWCMPSNYSTKQYTFAIFF